MNLVWIVFSAFLYVVAFPTWNAGITAFFALIPLFLAIENTRSIPRAMGYGVVWGALIAVGMGYWLLPTLIDHFNIWPPKAVLFFIISIAMPSCLIYGGFAVVYRFIHNRHFAWYALVVPGMWVLAEYIKEMLPVLIPWGSIGYALLPFHRFVQIADLGGIYGLAAAVVMINAVAWIMLHRGWQALSVLETEWSIKSVRHSIRVNRKVFYAPAALLIMAIILPTVYGTFRLNWLEEKVSDKMDAGVPLQAVLVQGNFDLDERWSGMGFYRRLQTYLDMSTNPTGKESSEKAAANLQERVIVWSETTLNEPARLNDALFQQIMEGVGENALLISGGLNQDDATGRISNCAYLISEDGTMTRYDKHILLPYAETAMMFDWLGKYYTAPSEFTIGRTPSCIRTAHGNVGLSICFEILYSRYIARSVDQGATFLVNMSNDAWFGDSPMPYMHLNAARMRAIENRRFLLRTANSGISAVISPSGKISSRSELFNRQAIAADFVHLDVISPYTRYGNWMVILSVGLLSLVFLFMVLKKD